jgi:hypothetical protein
MKNQELFFGEDGLKRKTKKESLYEKVGFYID